MDKLIFEPSLDTEEGVYFLILRGTLTWGEDNIVVDQVDEPFQVVIDSCFSNLDLSLVTMPDLKNDWYSETASFDISYIMNQVIPSKECGYPYSFDVARLEIDADGNELTTALPVEIRFNYDTELGYLGFELGKCDTIG